MERIYIVLIFNAGVLKLIAPVISCKKHQHTDWNSIQPKDLSDKYAEV